MTTTLRISTLLATPALAGLALVACNSYDPALGNQPFRCGTSSPRCPDGYTCVSYSPTDEVCELNGSNNGDRPDGGDNGGGDAGPVVCNNDSEIEPNNSVNDPTLTTIPNISDNYKLVGLAICPGTDEDFFRYEIDVAGKNSRIDVTYNPAQGELALDLLNENGVSIAQGSPAASDPNILRIDVPNMPQGVYFVNVRSAAGAQNNYSIEILTSN